MSPSLQPVKVGISLGFFLGGAHLLWSLFVALGIAQPLLGFIFRLHMIQPAYVVAPFDMSLAIGLVLITFVIGCIAGFLFALLWNWAHH